MESLLQLVIAATLVSVAVAGGYRLAIGRLGSDPPVQAMLALGFVLVTAAGGFWGALPWWNGMPGSFSWTLPPLAGRMLGAAAWSFALVCGLALLYPRRHMLRLVSLLVVVYLAPLAAAIVLQHLTRFDWGALITYGFFLIVVPLTGLALWFLVRPDWPEAEAFASRTYAGETLETGLLVGLALAAGSWGLAQFFGVRLALPGTSAVTYDLLTSRLIAVMLLTVAAAATHSIIDRRVRVPVLAFVALYGFGAATASLWNILEQRPLPVSYLVFWGMAGALAALGLVSRWRGTRRADG